VGWPATIGPSTNCASTRARASSRCGETIDDDVFDRLAARLSYVAGDFGDADTYERVARAIGGAGSPVFYLEIPPSLFGMTIKGLADAGLTLCARGGREALRPRHRLGRRARR
jgi:glucose-6-phosphate 1-dehydrogenase